MPATSKDVLFPDHDHLQPPVLMTLHFDYCPSTSDSKPQTTWQQTNEKVQKTLANSVCKGASQLTGLDRKFPLCNL